MTPTSIRVLDGRVVEQKSILDVRISIPSEEGRSTYDAVAAVIAAVERTTGHKILIGTVPLDLMSDTRMEQGSANEFARDILLRTLAATGTGLSWQLLYDPGLNSYALNVYSAR